jgi:transposase-like protein
MRDALGRNQPDHRRRQPQLVSTEERDRAILALRRRGLAYAEIARKVGCSDTVVARVVRRATE